MAMNFPTQLSEELDRDGRPRGVLAKAFRISPSNLSQYASGGEVCGGASLAKILDGWKDNPEAQERLAAAWLRDRIPEQISHGRISIVVNDASVQESAESWPEVDPELRSMLVYLMNRAMRHPEVRNALLGFGRALKG